MNYEVYTQKREYENLIIKLKENIYLLNNYEKKLNNLNNIIDKTLLIDDICYDKKKIINIISNIHKNKEQTNKLLISAKREYNNLLLEIGNME